VRLKYRGAPLGGLANMGLDRVEDKRCLYESPVTELVEDRLLIAFIALFDNDRFSINRGLSYLRALGLQWGVAINFGRTEARITRLRQRGKKEDSHG